MSALAKQPSDELVIEIGGDRDEFLKLIARGILVAGAQALHGLAGGRIQPPVPIAEREPPSEVMSADEVAEFLGVDRNTVYDFASRGVIPHQRLGKRLLFRRGAVVAWLDTSLCTATPARSA